MTHPGTSTKGVVSNFITQRPSLVLLKNRLVDYEDFGDAAGGTAFGGTLGGVDIVDTGLDALSGGIAAVPDEAAAVGTALGEDVSGRVGDFHQGVVHKAVNRNPAGVIGTDRVGEGINVVEVIVRRSRGRVIFDQSEFCSEIYGAGIVVAGHAVNLVGRQGGVLHRVVLYNLSSVLADKVNAGRESRDPFPVGSVDGDASDLLRIAKIVGEVGTVVAGHFDAAHAENIVLYDVGGFFNHANTVSTGAEP